MNLIVNILQDILFTRESDDAAIDRLSAELEALAAQTGRSEMMIANNVLRSVCEGGPAGDERLRMRRNGVDHVSSVAYGCTSPGSPRQLRRLRASRTRAFPRSLSEL